jgi:hypothetical protein
MSMQSSHPSLFRSIKQFVNRRPFPNSAEEELHERLDKVHALAIYLGPHRRQRLCDRSHPQRPDPAWKRGPVQVTLPDRSGDCRFGGLGRLQLCADHFSIPGWGRGLYGHQRQPGRIPFALAAAALLIDYT